MTYADIIRPNERRMAIGYDALLIGLGSLFIALMAQLAFTLPVNPLVPITGQTLAVLLIGAMFGSRRGALTVVAYIAEGAAGLPVFARGAAGPGTLLGPTGGYLLGFIVAAFLAGWLCERGWDRSLLTAAGAMVLGNLTIYLLGTSWLSVFIGLPKAITGGVLPFIPGDVIKIVIATILLPAGWRALAWLGIYDE